MRYCARGVDVLLAERVHDVGPVEQAALLLRRQAVLDVAVLQDLRQLAAPPVLARDVRDDLLLGRAPGEEERERVPQEAA